MKKILLIQIDQPYFLLETLHTVLFHLQDLAHLDLSLLVDRPSWEQIEHPKFRPLVKFLKFNRAEVQQDKFDMSINLSLNEDSWEFQQTISSNLKAGIQSSQGEVKVTDLWSTYLLTLKSHTPFLSFHLQDVYRNILGIKSFQKPRTSKQNVRSIVFGLSSTSFFSAEEQETFMNSLPRRLPGCVVRDISEIGHESSENILYIGPASLEAARLDAAKNIYLSSTFQGFNLVANRHATIILTPASGPIKAAELMEVVENIFQGKEAAHKSFEIYKQNQADGLLNFWSCNSMGEEHFPIYQAYAVLWSFLLNLQEIDIPLKKVTAEQEVLIKFQLQVLSKLIRLHDYAMVSIQTILQEAKSSSGKESETIAGHLQNLREIDETFNSIAEAHALLRPILDFYRIRRGQNEGKNLLEQVQNSMLSYHEEHQALQAFEELLQKLIRKSAPTE